jgi:putative ABC transport system permease protein
MRQDLKLAARLLVKDPRVTLIAVLALAGGIGANTAIFSVLNAVLLRPLAYGHPERLVVVMNTSNRRGGSAPVAAADFLDWQKQNTAFTSMAAAESWGPNLTGVEKAEKIPALRATGTLFQVLQVAPALGRVFTSADAEPGNERVVVVGDRFWRTRLGADPRALGRRLLLDGAAYTVIGVMPPAFRFAPFWQTKAELWAPLAMPPERARSRTGQSLRIFARLRPGISAAAAQAEMRTIAARLERQYPETNADRGARVTPLNDMVVGNVRPMLLALAGAVGFIVLIACANVANLLLARAAGRRREIAVRIALGASRARLLRQLLAESVLLALAGGSAGLLLAYWAVHALVAAMPATARFSLPRAQEIGVDFTVLLFTFALSLAAGILFGLVPAFDASRTELNASLKEGGRGVAGARGRIRGMLAAAEIALSIVLLTGAGLLLRSFEKLHSLDPGFQPRNAMAAVVSVAGTRHADPALRAGFYRQLVERVQALPGVESAAMINHLPLSGDVWSNGFTVAGQPVPSAGSVPNAVYRVALPGYFRTMKIPVLAGRDFTGYDNENSPRVAIVNQTLARRFWPGESAIGKRLRWDSAGPWLTVVAVVHDVAQHEWAVAPSNEIYVPFLQDPDYLHSSHGPWLGMTLVLRASSDPLPLASAVERIVAGLDKDAPVSEVETLDDVVSNALWQPRFATTLLAAFAALALLLAATGIYGVISYTVSRRSAEIGIRMALGARQRDVLTLVLRQSLTMTMAGLAAGLAGAFLVTGFLRSLLYGVSPADPLTFAAAAGLLTAVALAASLAPARRASRIDPVQALRAE